MCVCVLVFVYLCAWQGAHMSGVEGDCGEEGAEKEQEDLSLGRLKNPETKNLPRVLDLGRPLQETLRQETSPHTS